MARPLFQLGPRLAACAELVRQGSPVADVGTDHAYLPIWLLRTGKVPWAVACDINPGPLESARAHAHLYGVQDRLRLVLGDGLEGLTSEDAQDIVVAGMGGQMILRIVEAEWLRSPEKRLILQPMSAADRLRLGLCRRGFQVERELAVEDADRVYSAFSARYIGRCPETEEIFPYMGALPPGPAANRYAAKMVRVLTDRLAGSEHRGETEEARKLREIIGEIREKYAE